MSDSPTDAKPEPTPTTSTASARRPKVLAAVLMALAALAFWVSSRLTWATVYATDEMSPSRYLPVKGADWSPWLTPLALVLLAAILAAFSLRGWGLRLVAVLVALGGVLAAFPALSMMTSNSDSLYAARAIDLADRYVVKLTTTNSWVAAVVLAGTVLSVAAAIVLLRSAAGAGMSSKYKTPAARRAELEREIFADYEKRKADAAGRTETPESTETSESMETSKVTETSTASEESGADEPSPGAAKANERMMWDALDTGIDPTDPAR